MPSKMFFFPKTHQNYLLRRSKKVSTPAKPAKTTENSESTWSPVSSMKPWSFFLGGYEGEGMGLKLRLLHVLRPYLLKRYQTFFV